MHSEQPGSSDIEEARGTLRFQDWPDPPGRKVDSRMTITIKDEAKLPELLRTIGYRCVIDQILEFCSL
jgi:endonuclease I